MDINEKFRNQCFVLRQFYAFQPEAFDGVSDEGLELLEDTYLLRVEDVDSIDLGEHFQSKIDEDPELPKKLQPLLMKVADKVNLGTKARKRFLFEQNED